MPEQGEMKKIMRELTEFAWLIEAGDPPHYWDGFSPDSYTSDAYQAIRFSRFEDAEKVRCRLVTTGKHWKSVQHGFEPTRTFQPSH